MSDPRLHIVAVTADVVRQDGRLLLLKRNSQEIAFPGKYAPPGGKIVRHEYENLPRTDAHGFWHQIAEWTLRKEIKEEAGIEIEDLHYYDNWIFIRPDNIPVLMMNFWTAYKSGAVKPGKDFDDFIWVTPEEAKNHAIIEGLDERLRRTSDMLRGLKVIP
jgi:8-oxo-dGTP pyrophosphatase MutT (NUDIX family)